MTVKSINQMKRKLSNVSLNEGSSPTQLVHFELEDPSACKVCLAGSFNDWRPGATEMLNMGGGKWVKDLELPHGTYEYRFVVDGRWVTDQRCAHTVPNAFGEVNSLLILPESPARTATRRPSAVAAVVF